MQYFAIPFISHAPLGSAPQHLNNIQSYLLLQEEKCEKESNPILQTFPLSPRTTKHLYLIPTFISTNANTDQPDIRECVLSANYQDTANKSRVHKDLFTVSHFFVFPLPFYL
jgi:hypothetical protein